MPCREKSNIVGLEENELEVLGKVSQRKKNNALIIIPGSIDFRGIQIFFLNVLKYFDYSNLSIDLYFGGSCNNAEIEVALKSYGVGLYTGNSDMSTRKNESKYNEDIQALLRENDYTCVYVNSGMPWFNYIALKNAKKCGVPKRISHSHSSHIPSKKAIVRIFQSLLRLKSNSIATDFLACSEQAGVWMFGKRKMQKNGKVLYNGIDAKKYIYNAKVRDEYRRTYGVQEKSVVLHVGAFNSAKNQKFLVEVLSCLRDTTKDIVFILIGSGPTKEEICRLANQLGVADRIIFITETSHVENYMQMADLFVLPSVFEGLGIVNIEAQASGLKCLVSDVVPKMIDVTGLVTFKSLSDGPEEWAKVMSDMLNPYERKNTASMIENSGFDAKNTAEILQRIIMR